MVRRRAVKHIPGLSVAIMAGGAGTRFWPLSRAARPKQVLAIGAPEPLLRLALRRAGLVVPEDRIFIVTRAAQAAAVRRVAGPPPPDVVVEPAPRDTAPCVALASLRAAEKDPDAVLAVLPSDHLISPEAGFRRSVAAAVAAAGPDRIALIGIRPTRPATGFGYIEIGRTLRAPRSGPRVFEAAAFHEKPRLSRARMYVRSGRFLWNAGMFIARAAVLLREIEAHAPKLHRGLGEIRAGAERSRAEGRRVLDAVYPKLPRISFDRAVLERSKSVVVVEAAFSWDDVGSFSAAAAHLPTDGRGNAIVGSFQGRGNRRLYVHNDAPGLVTAIGLRDIVIVRTADAVLVVPKSLAEDVKRLVADLESGGLRRYL